MPLTDSENKVLDVLEGVNRLFWIVAILAFFYVLLLPERIPKVFPIIIGFLFCLVYWLTRKLLTITTRLDMELNDTIAALKKVKNYADSTTVK